MADDISTLDGFSDFEKVDPTLPPLYNGTAGTDIDLEFQL
jgi:hypothetical protein